MSDIPIVVSGSPSRVQIEAGFRQIILALGSVATALGAAKAAGQLNDLLVYAGAISAVLSFVWGQVVTRLHATKAAVMADRLPSSVAITK